MLGRLHKTQGRQPGGFQHHAAGHGEIAIHALAHHNTRVGRLRHIAEAPYRNAAPALFTRRIEVPVMHGVAKDGVGDVVGRECELVYAYPDLAGFEWQINVLAHGGIGQPIFAHQKMGCGHGGRLNPEAAVGLG